MRKNTRDDLSATSIFSVKSPVFLSMCSGHCECSMSDIPEQEISLCELNKAAYCIRFWNFWMDYFLLVYHFSTFLTSESLASSARSQGKFASENVDLYFPHFILRPHCFELTLLQNGIKNSRKNLN